MRFNIFGGPNSGKSTLSSYLFHYLKTKHYSVELVTEWIKPWAYQKRKLNKFDQCYIFGNQMQAEYQYLTSGVKNIVTDSSVFLSYIYQYYFSDYQFALHFCNLYLDYNKEYPSINFILENSSMDNYDENGRWQSAQEAKNINEIIESRVMLYFSNSTYKVKRDDYDKITSIIERFID